MRLLLMMLALLFATPQALAQNQGAARVAIEAAMTDSAQGWNAGQVDRFLAVYSDDPATSFTTSKGVARGKKDIRARYLVTYRGQFGDSADAVRSTLSFTFEDFRPLGSGHALLIARWKLVTGGDEGKADTGMTSLLFRKEAGGWKIIADHSS